jgi:hypothetical protein
MGYGGHFGLIQVSLQVSYCHFSVAEHILSHSFDRTYWVALRRLLCFYETDGNYPFLCSYLLASTISFTGKLDYALVCLFGWFFLTLSSFTLSNLLFVCKEDLKWVQKCVDFLSLVLSHFSSAGGCFRKMYLFTQVQVYPN